jgi:hypothetical protein
MNSKLLFTLLAVFIFASAPACRSEQDNTVLLKTLGYTTGQSILITHMAVGTLVDACKAKTYNASEANNFVTTYINVTQGLKTQMNKLLEAGMLSTSDTEFIKSSITVLDLVLEEANACKTYVNSKTDANAQAYNKVRLKALAEIKTLLGMKD